jgi:hypothetical protein
MSAVERELVQTIENMDIDGFLDDLDLNALPRRDEMTLHRNRQSLRMTLPADFWQENNPSLDEPGDVEVVYWNELGIAMIDLRGRDDE